MKNDKIKNNVNETEEKIETLKEENTDKVEVKKDEKDLEEPKYEYLYKTL